MSKKCIYCDVEKVDSEFSYEHIWPDALGGDLLNDFWTTDSVCRKCNNISGVFVDGSFIKGWAGATERAHGAIDYLSENPGNAGVMPLHYLGRLDSGPIVDGCVVEVWLGPCGAQMIHVWPNDEGVWDVYAGGDPRKKKKAALGTAYLILTSEVPYWLFCSLRSFDKHFARVERYVVNMANPEKLVPSLQVADFAGEQSIDKELIEFFLALPGKGEIKMKLALDLDSGSRFLAKLALALGYKIWGQSYLDTEDSMNLRRALREADPERRANIPISGSSYFSELSQGGYFKNLTWAGGWVLILMAVAGRLVLTVITPSGRPMMVSITEDANLLSLLDKDQVSGLVWVAVPSANKGAGPVSLMDYIAYHDGYRMHEELDALKRMRRTTPLPACR